MNDELIAAFLIEAPELIAQASDDLLALEQAPGDRARLDSAFRAFHTLKGSAAIFGFDTLTDMLHAAEDLLGAMREGRIVADDEALSCLLAAITRTERGLAEIEASGAPGPDQTGLAARIQAIMADGSDMAQAVDASALADVGWINPLLRLMPAGAAAATAVRYRPDPGCYFNGDDPVAIARGAPDILAFQIGLRQPAAADLYDPFDCNLEIGLVSAAAPAAVRAAFRFVTDQIQISPVSATREPAPESGGVTSRTLRIDAERIDRLAAAVDELVVAKTALAELAAQANGGLAVERIVDGLNLRRGEIDRLVARLHDTVVGLRLAPLAPMLRRLPRLAREASAALGKSITFAIDDEGTLADKSVVEGLFEPLMHLVRNAVDHGLEAPDERHAAGKPEKGRLDLKVARQGESIVVEVRDDGRGLDTARIRAAARARDLMPEAELDALTDAQVADIIFRPGFLTASAVTRLSGRGVGMDAVRSSIAALGGTVSVASEPGQGTAVTLVLPVNVVMTRLLMVEGRGELYGVPMTQVIETARVAADRIIPIRAGRAIVLRDVAVPLFDLGELLGGEAPDWAARDHRALVVRGEEGPLAVRVDGLLQSMDTVMRPMRGLLVGMRGVMGAALLGDGRVMLVVNPAELIG